MRGATLVSSLLRESVQFQSTRPMRGATGTEATERGHFRISIHAPHAGRDTYRGGNRGMKNEFQSTRPMRGATEDSEKYRASYKISIHAPHAGRDAGRPRSRERNDCISIHAPHAGRDACRFAVKVIYRPFQSTRPMRGATR